MCKDFPNLTVVWRGKATKKTQILELWTQKFLFWNYWQDHQENVRKKCKWVACKIKGKTINSIVWLFNSPKDERDAQYSVKGLDFNTPCHLHYFCQYVKYIKTFVSKTGIEGLHLIWPLFPSSYNPLYTYIDIKTNPCSPIKILEIL